MLLVTPSEEWMNVTRTSPSDSFLDDGSPSDLSLGVLSSNDLPSSSSLSSGTPDIVALLHTSEATPEIDRWRSSIPARAKDDNHSHYAESIDGGAANEASSRATSRLSSHIDDHAAVQHSAYTGYTRRIRNSRVATITAFSRILLYPWVAFDVVTQASLTGRTTTTPYLSAHFPAGPTVAYKPGLCPSTSYSCITNFEYTLTFASRSPEPIISKAADSPIIHHAEPVQSRVTRPRAWLFDTTSPISTTITILHPSSECFLLPRVATWLRLTHQTATKLLREHARLRHELFPSPAPARDPTEHAGVGRSLSIRTTNISHGSGVVHARSASIRVAPSRSGLASADGDPFDLPPA
ncbi:hypothetical protein EDB83DRAFT_2527279 [Lactarius deliciosus]|nr:hypothetical protein EDB83DRAFT_2527279 [Lactarius deliciosus]